MNLQAVKERGKIKFWGGVRYLMVHLASRYLHLYIVNEYPKSGGTWLGLMLSDALEVPFPRNRPPIFRSSIMHGHYFSLWNMRNVVVLVRDGRDVMISWYYHCMFEHEVGNADLVRRVRQDLGVDDPENIQKNLPEFIRYTFDGRSPLSFTWGEFVRKWWVPKRGVLVRYEDLRRNTRRELTRIVYELDKRVLGGDEAGQIVEKYSFERMTGRPSGVENRRSFMRKGIVGDWKNSFTREARVLFSKLAGEELCLAGYEKNQDWVEGVEKREL